MFLQSLGLSRQAILSNLSMISDFGLGQVITRIHLVYDCSMIYGHWCMSPSRHNPSPHIEWAKQVDALDLTAADPVGGHDGISSPGHCGTTPR